MIIGPKYKICKRLGGAVFEQCQTQKFALSEARTSKNKKRSTRPGNMSDFKRQLLEKQKMRFSYGISERQLVRYVNDAIVKDGDPVELLMKRLESRLDNVVYRMGIAKTRRLARQMVSHGHITVGGKKVTIPSYQVRSGEVIAVREGSKQSPLFLALKENTDVSKTPSWIRFDVAELRGEATAEPTYESAESLFDPAQVFEFYSR